MVKCISEILGRTSAQFPYMLMLEQSKNEELLYEFVRSQGRDVLWKTELESFSQDANGVTAQVKTSSGESQTITAKYLVGCDGASSPVRHGLGLTFEGSTFERLFYVADARVDWELPHDALHVCLAREVFTAFFPMKGENRYRIVGTFPESKNEEQGEVLYEEIERQIKDEAQTRARDFGCQMVFALQGPLASRQQVFRRKMFPCRRLGAHS